jgi:LmbE family N-acetylglucosaminyl deacetylase
MIHCAFDRASTEPFQVLCLGAHSDDIEIGCGGTILRLAAQYPNCLFHWVVLTAKGVREAEAKHAAALFAGDARLKGAYFKDFDDGFLPYVGGEVKLFFETLKGINPDLIFTHNRADFHQDHRLISELTWNTFRNHMILEYEIPKYDGDLGRPNLFVPLDAATCHKKVENLIEAFASQRAKPWFQENTFFSLLRLRGMECNAPSGFAEAFYCHKIVV